MAWRKEMSVHTQQTTPRTTTARRSAAIVATAALLAGLVALAPRPAAAANVGVSIAISEPGLYGRVDIGRFPQPAVFVSQPVLVAPPRVVVARPEPVYMWVPPGHRHQWARYCGQYRACGTPVVFVRDDWYDSHVRPHGHGRGHDKHGDGRKYDRKHDHRRDDGRPGRGPDHRRGG
jgi:hypothetical protein